MSWGRVGQAHRLGCGLGLVAVAAAVGDPLLGLAARSADLCCSRLATRFAERLVGAEGETRTPAGRFFVNPNGGDMNRLPRLSPAMVVACVALLVALGGTSIAAETALAPGSVTTAAIRNGAVTTTKLHSNAVTLSKLAPNARIPGPKGDPGTNGTNGKDGSPGVSGLVVVTGSDVTLPPNAGGTAHVSCPAGKTALAGGVIATPRSAP